jgi:hypothetical protein
LAPSRSPRSRLTHPAGFWWRSLSHHDLRTERWCWSRASNVNVAESIWSLLGSDHGEHSYAAYVDCVDLQSQTETDRSAATYNVYLTLEQEIEAQTNTILNATGCTNGTVDSQVACIRALGADDLASASGIANNVVIDGSYITQPYIYFNGTVSSQPF